MDFETESLPIFSHEERPMELCFLQIKFLVKELADRSLNEYFNFLLTITFADTIQDTLVDLKRLPACNEKIMRAMHGNSHLRETCQFVAKDDVADWICGLALKFVTNHEGIQRRANAYVRSKLASAELIMNGEVVCVNDTLAEMDQKLIMTSCETSPEFSRCASSLNPSGLANDVSDDLITELLNLEQYFVPDVHTEEAIRLFHDNLLRHYPACTQGSLDKRYMIQEDLIKLSELFESFDEKYTGRIGLQDTMRGVVVFAHNYIWYDSSSENIVHTYIKDLLKQSREQLDVAHKQLLEACITQAALSSSRAVLASSSSPSPCACACACASDTSSYASSSASSSSTSEASPHTSSSSSSSSSCDRDNEQSSVDDQSHLHSHSHMARTGDHIVDMLNAQYGSEFRFLPKLEPSPLKFDYYPLWFKTKSKRTTVLFNRVDYGISFVPFFDEELRSVALSADAPFGLALQLNETNRCFFIHLGIAMNIHPYGMQHCFRVAAKEILGRNEEDMTKALFGEPLESILSDHEENFIDASVLNAIWPLEFDGYRIMVAKLDHNDNFENFTVFTPTINDVSYPLNEDGSWAGKDIILLLQMNHFELLVPIQEHCSSPITHVLEATRMVSTIPLMEIPVAVTLPRVQISLLSHEFAKKNSDMPHK